MAIYNYLLVALLLIVAAIISVTTQKLTISAAISGVVVGTLVFYGTGYTGLTMLSAFFVLGTSATSWKKKEKQSAKATGDQSVQRNAGQVLANGGVAGIMGILTGLIPLKADLFVLMMSASLASAMADTLSSELGMVFGCRFYNIITFKRDQKGLDGVISLEGTLMGVTGSAIIAIIYAIGFGWNKGFLLIIICGTIGNLTDSVLGATLERKHYLNNDMVNFLNTLIAALAAGVLYLLM